MSSRTVIEGVIATVIATVIPRISCLRGVILTVIIATRGPPNVIASVIHP